MISRMPKALAVLDGEIAFLQGNAKRERERGNQIAALIFDSRVSGIRKARAAFEGLIATVNALMEYRVGEYPTRGDIQDNAASRAQIDAVATALAAAEVLK